MPELRKIAAQPRLLKRGEKLFHDGEKLSNLYAVRSGAIKTYKTTVDGRDQIVDFHLPGDLVGLNGIINRNHSCHALALDTTSVCAVGYNDLMGLCERFPRVQHYLLKRISACVIRNEQFVVNLRTRDATERVAGFLVTLSEYYDANGFCATNFALPISRTDIGNYLNLAVETVSRIFSRFRREGVASFTGNMASVQDLAVLYQAAGKPLPTSARKCVAAN